MVRWLSMFALFAATSLGTALVQAQDAAQREIWDGVLNAGQKLRIEFHLSKNDQDQWSGHLVSVDQGGARINLDSVSFADDQLKIEIKLVGGGFSGKLNESRTEAEGNWSQGPAKLPLTLKRRKDDGQAPPPQGPKWENRPQRPTAPFPYESIDVKFKNSVDNVELAGTLTLPKSEQPIPAVILVSGSGPQDRDETLMEHKPFLVLADHLSRNGIAVLRYDDRGVGQSLGDFSAASTREFANDAEAAIDYLAGRPEIDNQKIGLIGHSEGGLIGPMVANRNGNVSFLVLLAGPAVPGTTIIQTQSAAIARRMGAGENDIQQSQDLNQRLFSTLARLEADDPPMPKLKAAFDQWVLTLPEDQQDQAKAGVASIRPMVSPWFRFFLEYNPIQELENLKVPTLALFGEKDLQVLVDTNEPPMKKALAKSGVSGSEVIVMPGLNHLFQQAKTGLPAEYVAIDETMNPEVLDKIKQWIHARLF